MDTPETVCMVLDQSPTATGWAIGVPLDQRPAFGVFRMETWGAAEGARLLQFHRWLLDKCQSNGVHRIFYEEPVLPRHGNLDAIEKQLFLVGHINFVAALLKLPVAQVPIQSWRSRFLGTSKPPPGLTGDAGRKELKRMAIKSCAMRGWLVEDDNAAEALGILDYALSTVSHKHAGARDPIFRRAELNLWKGER